MRTPLLSKISATLGVALLVAAPAIAQTDSLAPSLVRVFAVDSNHIIATFNEPVTAATANVKWNFSGAGSMASSSLLPGDTSVRITLNGALPDGTPTTLSVANIKDVAGNAMPLPQSKAFLFNDGMPNVAITEIYYKSPGTNVTNDSLEYFEIYNPSTKPAKLGGMRVRGSVNYAFPAYFSLQPGERRIIARSPQRMYAVFGKNALRWSTGFLPNTSGRIVIVNSVNQRIDSVTYASSAAWVDSITATTHTITYCDLSQDNAQASAWGACVVFGAIHPVTNDSLFCSPLSGCGVVVIDTVADTTGTVATRNVDILLMGMYPNPAQNSTNVSLPFSGMSQVAIIDRMGRVVYTGTVNTTATLPLAGLANGLYIVRATEANGRNVAQASLVITGN